MKRFPYLIVVLVAIGLLVVALSLTFCAPPGAGIALTSNAQLTADQVVRQTIYVKDPRTGFCFAVYNSITNVPCGPIPSELLFVGKDPNTPQR